MKNIAIMGFGTVGSGVYEVLNKNAEKLKRIVGDEIKVSHILDRKDFKDEPFVDIVTDDFEKILSDEKVDIVVETMGGIEPTFNFSKKALESGKTVVSSNKELVEKHGAQLMKIAYQNGVKYLFEASVGGGIPIITPLSHCLAGNEVIGIRGILNGTTNFMLTKMMTSDYSYDDCLELARELGYAEADPSADVKGYDAGRKIAILASIVTGKNCAYDDIYVEGIDEIIPEMIHFAQKFEMTIKLVARADFSGAKPSIIVSPCLLASEELLSKVDDVFNAALVEGNAVGETIFYGKGAGKYATASAVVGDILDALSGRRFEPLWSEEKLEICEKNEMKYRSFIMFKTDERELLEKATGEIFFENLDWYGFFTELITEAELELIVKEKLAGAKDIKLVRTSGYKYFKMLADEGGTIQLKKMEKH